MKTRYLLLLPVLIFCCAPPAACRIFKVNSVYDVNDLDAGNGLCVAYIFVSPPYVLPFCTLRAAIEESNSFPGHDIIELPSGFFNLEIAGEGENQSSTGDLDITESLTLAGSGAGQTVIDGRSLDRLIDVLGPDTEVVISDVTLKSGRVASDASALPGGGGAIRNSGALTLRNVILLQHQVSGRGSNQGGILLNSGQCSIDRSTLRQGSADKGGAIYNAAGASLSLVSSTLSHNNAATGGGVGNYGMMRVINSTISTNGSHGTLYGGGIANRGNLFLEHATIADNIAASGGGIHAERTVSLKNTLVGNNPGGDCSMARYIFSQGYNLDSDGSCMLNAAMDISAADPGLRKLANYGGTTQTHGLYPYSAARDSGMIGSAVLKDQRGVVRPQGNASDIGAFEFDGFPSIPMIYPLLF